MDAKSSWVHRTFTLSQCTAAWGTATAMLRDALALLGGTETWTTVNYGWYGGSRTEIMYVIPIDVVHPAAAA